MPDFKIEITVKDVADGDVIDLVEAIAENYGEDFDAARGDFAIRVSKAEGSNWFPYEPGNE
jgi:hypothetical protein